MSSARCKIAGCRRKAHARGLCQKHYDEKRKSKASRRSKVKATEGKPTSRKSSRRTKPVLDEGDDGKMCRVPGCANAHHAKGYCKMHYGQLRRRGNVEELPDDEVAEAPALSLDQRLVEIKKRHELLKREIASIHQALESETEPGSGDGDDDEEDENGAE